MIVTFMIRGKWTCLDFKMIFVYGRSEIEDMTFMPKMENLGGWLLVSKQIQSKVYIYHILNRKGVVITTEWKKTIHYNLPEV